MSITKSGRWPRSRSASRTSAAVRSGRSPPMQVSTTSERRSSSGSSSRPWARRAEARWRASPRARGVRFATRTRAEPGVAHRLERELDHVAGADQQRHLVLEALEDLAREVDGDARHRDRTLGDAGLVPHALRRREGVRIEPRQDRAAGAARDGDAVGVLHLTEDLRLADHHRVDRARDAEQVAHRGAVHQLVERVVELTAASRPRLRARARARRTSAGAGAPRRARGVQTTTSTRLQVESSTASSISGAGDELREHGRARPRRRSARAARAVPCGGSCRASSRFTQHPEPTTTASRSAKPAAAPSAATARALPRRRSARPTSTA